MSAYGEFQDRYYDDPAGFARDCFRFRPGEEPAEYQLDAMRSIPTFKRVCIRAPRGAGKSTISAWALLWFALTRDGEDWKAITTASVWRQLSEFLWPEIHKWARRLNYDRIGRDGFDSTELLNLSLRLTTGHAFAVSTNQPTAVEGAHADHLFYIFDESKAISDEIFDATEGAFSSGSETFVLAISTPGEPSGRFYDIQSLKEGYEDWHVRHITLEEAIAAGRINRDWVDARRRQWGEHSTTFRNHVLAEFCIGDEEGGIVPRDWINTSVARWHAIREAGSIPKLTGLGVDLGWQGDLTVIAARHENYIAEPIRFSGLNTMQVVGQIMNIVNRFPCWVRVDVTGIGAGVFDRLKELGCNVIPFMGRLPASNATDSTGQIEYLNLRAKSYWELREALDPLSQVGLAIPDDQMLKEELMAIRWGFTEGGRLRIESKDILRSRLGKSPDTADAVMMSFIEHVPRKHPHVKRPVIRPIG